MEPYEQRLLKRVKQAGPGYLMIVVDENSRFDLGVGKWTGRELPGPDGIIYQLELEFPNGDKHWFSLYNLDFHGGITNQK